MFFIFYLFNLISNRQKYAFKVFLSFLLFILRIWGSGSLYVWAKKIWATLIPWLCVPKLSAELPAAFSDAWSSEGAPDLVEQRTVFLSKKFSFN